MRSNVVFHLCQVNLAIGSSFAVFFFFSFQFWENIEFGTVHTSDNIFMWRCLAANKLCGPSTGRFNSQFDVVVFSLCRSCRVLLSVCSAFRLFSHTTLFSFGRCLMYLSKFSVLNVYVYRRSQRIYIRIYFSGAFWCFMDFVGILSCLDVSFFVFLFFILVLLSSIFNVRSDAFIGPDGTNLVLSHDQRNCKMLLHGFADYIE